MRGMQLVSTWAHNGVNIQTWANSLDKAPENGTLPGFLFSFLENKNEAEMFNETSKQTSPINEGIGPPVNN